LPPATFAIEPFLRQYSRIIHEIAIHPGLNFTVKVL